MNTIPSSSAPDRDDPITQLLRDEHSSATARLASAPRTGFTRSQIRELESEVDFFDALLKGSIKPPRPPGYVLERMQTLLAIWEEAVQEASQLAKLDRDQVALRDAAIARLNSLQATMRQFAQRP
jgi:hypothetical protein